MFWDATYTPSPKIEALLNTENVTLLELIDDEEIISECKSQNSKLVQFLNRPDILEELITLITTVPPPNAVDTLRFKHSNVACEILTSDLQSINRSIVSDEKVLARLYAFLEQEAPLNPLLLSFFSKVFGMLWTQKQKQDWFTYQFVCVTVLEFLKSRNNFMDTILRHVYSPVILDLVYHMMTHIEGPDIRKPLYDWLMDQQLVEKLIGVLGEKGEDAADKHLNVAQFVVEYLSMGRTKRQSEKQEGGNSDPILDRLEDKRTIQLLLDMMVTEDPSETSCSAIVAGTRIILALFDDNLINDNTDDPALQYLVNSEKEHHQEVVANLMEIIKGYVNKFHDLLLIEPAPIISTSSDSGVSDETVVLSSAGDLESASPEKDSDGRGDDSKDSGKVSDGEKLDDEEEEEGETEVGKKGLEEDVSSTSENSSSSIEADGNKTPDNESAGAVTAGPDDGEEAGDVQQQKPQPTLVPRRNNFSRSQPFGNTRLQICCLFTVLLETENRDIINAICASDLFKTLLNLFKQYCWNNFLHSQVKKCLTYAIGAYDELKEGATGAVQLEVSSLQRHLIVDCRLAPALLDCWFANEREQVERHGHRLGYMGHLISVLEALVSSAKVSEKLRALIEETLAAATEPDGRDYKAMWTTVVGGEAAAGELETELSNQTRFLADCNPCKVNECEPKDFFIEATDTFQDLEPTALSENLDNFLSRYISSDLTSHFFNTINGWTEDNLDEFEGLADKNWSKFDGDADASSNPLSFASPWENDDEDEEQQSPQSSQSSDDAEAKMSPSSAGAGPSAVAQSGLDSGWANFSSANFADFDTHFNEFAIGTFDGTEVGQSANGAGVAAAATANTTFDKLNESLDAGAEGDAKNESLEKDALTTDSNSDANDTKKSESKSEGSTTESTEKESPTSSSSDSPVSSTLDVGETGSAGAATTPTTRAAADLIGGADAGATAAAVADPVRVADGGDDEPVANVESCDAAAGSGLTDKMERCSLSEATTTTTAATGGRDASSSGTPPEVVVVENGEQT